MKKILSLLLLVPTIAWSQDNTAPRTMALTTVAPCDPVPKMFSVIEGYREGMLFSGTGMTFLTNRQPVTGGMFIFVNQDKGTFSIVQVFSDGMACMLANGRDFTPYGGPQPWEIDKGEDG
jgi:hypothetical protein